MVCRQLFRFERIEEIEPTKNLDFVDSQEFDTEGLHVKVEVYEDMSFNKFYVVDETEPEVLGRRIKPDVVIYMCDTLTESLMLEDYLASRHRFGPSPKLWEKYI